MGGSGYHEEWGDDPVHYDTEAQLYPHLTVCKDSVECFVLDFAEDGVYHYKKTDGCSRRYQHHGLPKLMKGCLPIGMDTPTNLPLCSAGPTLGT